jgi:hypothetical protein
MSSDAEMAVIIQGVDTTKEAKNVAQQCTAKPVDDMSQKNT